ncbi:MAG: hypothetical protein ACYC0H_19290, partial [Solirubrobacteraceae bacterium]
GLGSHLSVDLSRRVYAGPEGTIDLVPGPGSIGCVVQVAGTGKRIAGTTTTALAASGTHGFLSGHRDGSTTVRGVLSTAVRSLKLSTAAGQSITATVNGDDAYWITVPEPVQMVLVMQDGTERPLPPALAG